jgi:nicotinamide riboside transporter PnuC
MSDRPAPAADHSSSNWLLFLTLSVYLIGTFLWRTLTKAHESPLRTMQLMTMGLDAVAIIGLIGLNARLSKAKPLFWIALIAGLGLFAIRFSDDASWWNGHLYTNLCPRQGEAIVCRCRDDFVSWLCP